MMPPLTAWPEVDLLPDSRSASRAPALANSQVTERLVEYQTRPVFISDSVQIRYDSQQRTANWFMEALGGEIRPDSEAERAFASARARQLRPADDIRRRSGPPSAG
ncbi:hypothetical protein BH20GEM2_BH20GEM2_06010 [soil metagenome]